MAHEFPPRRDYSSVSMRDLLDAREASRVFFSTLPNVLATAILPLAEESGNIWTMTRSDAQ